jgi:Putative transposase
MTHGGVSEQGQWVEPKTVSLFPQKAVMRKFRGKMLAMIKAALKQPEWVLPPERRQNQVISLLNKLGRKAWVVHFCDRYDRADGVAKYLSRYVKSGPLKNHQIKAVNNSTVCFQYKSHETREMELMVLPVAEFIHRLVQHVPTPGKPTVRYCGLYNSAARNKLNVARSALDQEPVTEKEVLDWQRFLESKDSLPVCTECGAPIVHMRKIAALRKTA